MSAPNGSLLARLAGWLINRNGLVMNNKFTIEEALIRAESEAYSGLQALEGVPGSEAQYCRNVLGGIEDVAKASRQIGKDTMREAIVLLVMAAQQKGRADAIAKASKQIEAVA